MVKEAEKIAAAASAPTYESMVGGRTRGSLKRSPVRDLVPGVPVRYWGAGQIAYARTNVGTIAKKYGIPITTTVVDGVLWVCRLKPEDAK